MKSRLWVISGQVRGVSFGNIIPFPAIAKTTSKKKKFGLHDITLSLRNGDQILLKDVADTLPADFLSDVSE